jgi:acetyltransferase-like isoleucine patch superfamily enzyme
MKTNTYLLKFQRLQELLLTTLFGSIPTIFLGVKLRNIIYKLIFNRLGHRVYIQYGVEFIGTEKIQIGDGVHIFRGVRIDAKGHAENEICIGNGVALEQGVNIGSMDDTSIYINEGTFIAPNVSIAGPGNIRIGKDCLIAANSGIFANNHVFSDIHQNIAAQGVTRQGIQIEDDCWLGHGVTVLDGVTIGKGSVIGAGSVVTKNIPPYSVAVGVPAKVIKSRIEHQQTKREFGNEWRESA